MNLIDKIFVANFIVAILSFLSNMILLKVKNINPEKARKLEEQSDKLKKQFNPKEDNPLQLFNEKDDDSNSNHFMNALAMYIIVSLIPLFNLLLLYSNIKSIIYILLEE